MIRIFTAGLDSTKGPLTLIDVAELGGLSKARVPAVVVVPSQPLSLVPSLAGIDLSPVETVQPLRRLIDVSAVNSPEIPVLQSLNLTVIHWS